MTTLADVVAEARSWIGTPYLHQGRMKGVGVDCVGLMFGTAEALGLNVSVYEIHGYTKRPDPTLMIAGCDRFMTRVSRSALTPGLVAVLMRYGAPQHMGVVADYPHGGLSMIHALGTLGGKGKVIEQRLSKELRAQVVQAYRLPGVE